MRREREAGEAGRPGGPGQAADPFADGLPSRAEFVAKLLASNGGTAEHWNAVYDRLVAEREAKRPADSLHAPHPARGRVPDMPDRDPFLTEHLARHGGTRERWNRVYDWLDDWHCLKADAPRDNAADKRSYVQMAVTTFGGKPEKWAAEWDRQWAPIRAARGDGRPPEKADFVRAGVGAFGGTAASWGAEYDRRLAAYRKAAGLG